MAIRPKPGAVQERTSPDLPLPGAKPSARGKKPLTVLALLKVMRAEYERQKPRLEEAELRERIVMGEQWRGRDPMIERVLSSSLNDNELITENLLYPLSQTWIARVTEGDLTALAGPFQPDQADTSGARAANLVLDFHRQKNTEEVIVADAAELAQYHGDVLFLPTWQADDGPHLVRKHKLDANGPMFDMVTQTPITEMSWEYGGVIEDVIPAPDYWTSGEQEYRKASCLCVRRIIDEHDAGAQLEAAGFLGAGPTAEDFPTAMDESRHGVEAIEMWLKPGPRSSTGAKCLIIDERVVKCDPWPLKDKTRLPGAQWKVGLIRGSSRGKTHVADAIHQQRLVNRTLRSIMKRAEAAEAATLFAPSEVIDALKDASLHRCRNDEAGAESADKRVFWRAGPEIPPSLFQAYDRARRALYDVFGVSEATTTGGDPTQTNSGAQLQTATALDAQKNKGPRARLKEARRLVAQQVLELWQSNVKEEMLIRVLGADGAVTAEFLRAADVNGADVQIEMREGAYMTHLGGEVEAEQEGAAGFIPSAAAAERRRTGLRSTISDAQAGARVDAQARAAMAGQPSQPYPDVDPGMAVQRVQIAIGAAHMQGLQPEQIAAAAQLAQAYATAAQQRQAAAPQQQPAAGQPPQQGPGRRTPSVQRNQPGAKAGVTPIRQNQLPQETIQ